MYWLTACCIHNYGSKQKYVNRYIGVNSRLDELHAAMLRVKCDLGRLIQHKRVLAGIYFTELPEWIAKPVRDQRI